MKRFAYYITCCSLVALFSCTHDDVYEVLTPVGDGRITIQSTLDDMTITRAAEGEVDDTNPERTVKHIDVFAIDKNGNVAYYERNTTGNNNGAAEDGAGKLTLQVARRAKDADGNFYFAQGELYRFILVANATATSEYMATLTTLADLENAVQDDSFETSFAGGGSTTDDTTEGETGSTTDGTTDGETGSGTDNTTGGATESTPTMSRQTLLHLTGTSQGENPDVETPQVFLMDAVATDANGNQECVVNPASGSVDNLDLEAEFKRAASKIVVNITQGKDVEFRTELDAESTQYDFYKLPASTFVLPNESKLVNIQLINTAPQKNNDETFVWEHTDASNKKPRPENSITVIGYAYSHSWSDVDLTNETSLILNIPMMWNKDNKSDTGYGYTENNIEYPNFQDNGKEEAAPRSWYKVPLSQGKKFERNKCYIVNVTINAVGASTRSTAIELRDIEYITLDWQDVDITVGNSSESPAYLTLNTDLVEIYNANFDNTSLTFSSSSAIASVTLKDVYKQNADGTFTVDTDSHSAYYINKFGIPTDLSTSVLNTISATAEENVLNGGISILSPIVPATQAEIEEQIAALPKPVEPTLSEPTYNGTIPPEVANPGPQPNKPNPEDYVPENGASLSDMRYYQYQYNSETGKFQRRYATGWEEYSDWEDIADPEDYVAALEAYNNYETKLKEYNDYLAKIEELKKDLDYQAYLEAKEAYDDAWAEYNDQLADYNTKVEEIRNSGGEETHYNTIRYLEFEVTNEQGLTATFRVMQYPIVYITNIQGWYSYRDDFGGTTLESKGNTTTSNNNFKSKVAFEITSGNNRGLSNIYRYSWSKNSNTVNDKSESIYTGDYPGNARMYHVKITATSDEYTLGKPRLDADGYTDSSAENNRLVSPSFMLASQLGALSNTFSEISSVRTHCLQYVEVYKDKDGNKVVLNDWRLPTRAELEIIIKYQYSSDAMDEVIRRKGYWCADGGQVTNSQGMDGTGWLRCIRDAY